MDQSLLDIGTCKQAHRLLADCTCFAPERIWDSPRARYGWRPGDLFASHNGYTGARESGMVGAHFKLGMIVGHAVFRQAHDPERSDLCLRGTIVDHHNLPHPSLIRGMLEAYLMQDLTNRFWSTCTG